MKELSRRLAYIQKGDEPARLEEARILIDKLASMNMRWNIEALNKFLSQRMRELFY